ncbi:MAG: rhodanese-like domain-containing protein [Pseudanabaenaceae cyanobacterium]
MVNSVCTPEMDAATLRPLWENGEVILVDIREPSEYAGEHIPEAISLPLSRLRPEDLPTAKPVVLYCQSGNRSAQALARVGHSSVSHLRGGLIAWKAGGHPVTVNRKAPISLMRQVQIVAGSLVVLGTVLGAFVSPWFLLLSGFVGSGLVFAGVTNTCGLAMLLAQLPYNRRAF